MIAGEKEKRRVEHQKIRTHVGNKTTVIPQNIQKSEPLVLRFQRFQGSNKYTRMKPEMWSQASALSQENIFSQKAILYAMMDTEKIFTKAASIRKSPTKQTWSPIGQFLNY